MANTQTLVVEKVERDGQWHRVFFDGESEPYSTKDDNLAKIAMAHRGQEAEVVTNISGKYRYLNGIAGERETRGGSTSSAAPAAPRRGGGGGGRDPQTQKDIAAQWAVGRALEVFTLTDSSVALTGLTAEQQEFILMTATYVAELRDKLAK